MYYICKITFDSGEVNKSGKPITTKTQILVEAESVTHAEARVVEHLGNGIATTEVTSVSQSPIESVLQLNN
jgi:hypothetical protein